MILNGMPVTRGLLSLCSQITGMITSPSRHYRYSEILGGRSSFRRELNMGTRRSTVARSCGLCACNSIRVPVATEHLSARDNLVVEPYTFFAGSNDYSCVNLHWLMGEAELGLGPSSIVVFRRHNTVRLDPIAILRAESAE